MKKRLLDLQEAISFLTLLPLPFERPRGREASGWPGALIWFPLVGGMIGFIAGSAAECALKVWSPSVASLVGLSVMTVVTGGLHLDGFSDTVDGMSRRGSASETLQVMRDARLGAMGAMALVLLLLLKWTLIESLLGWNFPARLAAVCALGRFSVVVCAQSFAYVPGEKGLGERATQPLFTLGRVTSLLLAVGVALCGLGPLRAAAALFLAGILGWSLGFLFSRRLKGVTGDILGCVNEVVEVGLLFYLVAR